MGDRFFIVVAVLRTGAAICIAAASNATGDDLLWSTMNSEADLAVLFRRGLGRPQSPGLWCACGRVGAAISIAGHDAPVPDWRHPEGAELDAIVHGLTPHAVVRWLRGEPWAE